MSESNFSKDYKKLFESICNGDVVAAFVDHAFLSDPKDVMRDVCQVKRTAPFNIQIAARGISYGGIYSFMSDEGDEFELFEKQCTRMNLEFTDSEMLRTQAAKIEELQLENESLKQVARFETDVAQQAIADFEEAKGKIEELEKASQWRPIETAPKDGEEILVMYMHIDTQIVHNGFWLEDPQDPDSTGWWTYLRSEGAREKLEGWRMPTHWIPLPKLPAIKGEQA